MTPRAYPTPEAFRQALEQRMRAAAESKSSDLKIHRSMNGEGPTDIVN